MLKKSLAIGLSVVMAAEVLTGCSGGSGTTETKAADTGKTEAAASEAATEGGSGEEKTLTVFHYMGQSVKQQGLEKLEEEFKKTHPNITFENIFYNQGTDYFPQLSTALASGEQPDIIMGNPATYPDLIENGYAMDLTDKDARLRSEHAQIIAPEDIERFRKLGVIPTHQTVFLRTDKNVADARLGAERIKGAYAWRTLIDQGNPLPNGTDSPVESCNPFLSMYCAVTRKDEHLKPEGGWHPQEAMTREEALRSYTNWAAYAAFEEQLKGSIEPGKLADFVVIDRDYMKCPEEEIKDICSLQTVVGGEVVYETK